MLAVDASSPLAKNVAAMTAPLARALRALTLAAACGIALGAQAAAAEDAPIAAPTIYKWVDTNGIAHYTTELGRVPRSVRGSVRALGSGGASPGDGFAARDFSPEDPNATAGAPGAVPTPSASPTAGASPTDWDQGSAGAAAAAPTGARDGDAATPAAGDGDAAFAATDRPAELPSDADAPEAPTQTASAAVAAELTAADPGDLDARIAALEAEIASDEEALKDILAAPGPADPGLIAYDASFREVAERLPKRLAELRTLQSERAQLDQP